MSHMPRLDFQQTIYEINQYGDGVIVGEIFENGELEVDINALETLEVPMMLFHLSRDVFIIG